MCIILGQDGAYLNAQAGLAYAGWSCDREHTDVGTPEQPGSRLNFAPSADEGGWLDRQTLAERDRLNWIRTLLGKRDRRWLRHGWFLA